MVEILCELERDEMSEHGLPPRFRFHLTDEEFIPFYLASKVFNAPSPAPRVLKLTSTDASLDSDGRGRVVFLQLKRPEPNWASVKPSNGVHEYCLEGVFSCRHTRKNRITKCLVRLSHLMVFESRYGASMDVLVKFGVEGPSLSGLQRNVSASANLNNLALSSTRACRWWLVFR